MDQSPSALYDGKQKTTYGAGSTNSGVFGFKLMNDLLGNNPSTSSLNMKNRTG